MITFAVADVVPNTTRISAKDSNHALKKLLPYPIEQIGPLPPLAICGEEHPLIAAAVNAFTERRPLVLSPDIIWFCIAQGFANHMAIHAEELREHFVDHQGKKQLEVERDDFVIGHTNPWHEVFAQFSSLIGADTKDSIQKVTVADFSTTDLSSRAASAVLTMDAFQYYFEYVLTLVGCEDPSQEEKEKPREGIPSITLLGTPTDWHSVRTRALALAKYGLSEWINHLQPILDALVATAEGTVDRAFWQSFFHYRNSWAGENITGWVNLLFPYLELGNNQPYPNFNAFHWQQCLRDSQEATAIALPPMAQQPAGMPDAEFKHRIDLGKQGYGPSASSFPAGFCSAPVKLITPIDQFAIRFIGGLFGVSQDTANGALTPAFGWAVVYDQLQPIKKGEHNSDLDDLINLLL